jgi:serine/threonine protein kinase
MRVRSRDLKLVQFLGQGFSGFIYETSWLTWYGKEKPGRFARKSFPRVGSMVFESEAIRLVHLDHPNVVKAFCWTVDKLGCSLVLEFVNTDIESVVEKRKEAQRKVSAFKDLLGLGNFDKSINGTISPFELIDQIYIMLHIARAMEYLHSKGVGHGDLRPNNILVDLEANPMIVKVVDFGLLESKKRSSLVSKRTQFVRTLEWKAPETWKDLPTSLLDSPDEYLWEELDLMKEGGNVSAVGELADVYSFAVTCTYIMGGTVSYPKLSLSQLQQRISSGTLRPKIPSECPEVLRKLIELSWDSNPQKRQRFSYLRVQLEKSFELVEVKGQAQAKQMVQEEKMVQAKRMLPTQTKRAISGK